MNDLASITVYEHMGYTVDTLRIGTITHNNRTVKFTQIPAELEGLRYTQVVACITSPVKVHFDSTGKLFVLVATDWSGYYQNVQYLQHKAEKLSLPVVRTDSQVAFEVWTLKGVSGEKLTFPTQIAFATNDIKIHKKTHLVILGRAGGFFSLFFQVIEQLLFANARGLTPIIYFNRNCNYWSDDGFLGLRNVWEYYFESFSNNSIADLNLPAPLSEIERLTISEMRSRFEENCGAMFSASYHGRDVGMFGKISGEQRETAHLICKTIKLKPEIQKKIDEIIESIGSEYLGVHYRGTDKYSECPEIPLDKLRREIDKSGFNKIFVATEDTRKLESLIHIYGKRVFCTNAIRSSDVPPHRMQGIDRAAAGAEAVVDCLLLSKSTFFLHGQSNLSAAALAFNIDLKHYEL